MFIRYYKKNVRDENISFYNFCSENIKHVICKKKNQETPVVGTVTIIVVRFLRYITYSTNLDSVRMSRMLLNQTWKHLELY
jgi:hypothetical protein